MLKPKMHYISVFYHVFFSFIDQITINNINSTVGYIMLNALLPGKNYLWNLNFAKTLLNNLELRFDYEGRNPGNSRRVQERPR